MRKFECGMIDPYGLGLVVILFGALFGGIQHSGDTNKQASNTQDITANNQVPAHDTNK